jgi:hypothetical protein
MSCSKMTNLEKIPHLAFDYKDGGWESRLRRVFSREAGPNLGRKPEET